MDSLPGAKGDFFETTALSSFLETIMKCSET